MQLTVVTPVGPGHEYIVGRAVSSVVEASKRPGRFTEITHKVIPDASGLLGRGKARNLGMTKGWMFFLDADDAMMPDALEQVDISVEATFGAVCVEGRITDANLFPCTKPMLKVYGARGTISMGFFYKGNLKFSEDMTAGEDFDFYMRLKSFTKVEKPLVSIGRSVPSAGGPKGYGKLDWLAVCKEVIDAY